MNVTAPVPPLHCDDVPDVVVVSEHTVTVPLHCDAPPAGFKNHFLIVNTTQHGQLGTIDQNASSVTFRPTDGFTGTDTFSYNATSSDTPVGGGGWGYVTITVLPQPAPVCDPVDLQDGVVDLPRTISLSCVTPSGHPQTYAIDSQPAHGTLSALDAQAGTVLYTPDASYRGADNFNYSATSDRGTGSAAVTLFMHQRPITCTSRTENIAPDSAKTFTLDCPYADQISVLSQPAHGTLTGLDAATGEITYTPDLDSFGPDSFTFKATNHDHTSPDATIDLAVAAWPAPDCAPVDLQNGVVGVPRTITMSCATNIRHPQTFAINTQPAHGTLTDLDAQAGTVLYSPQAGYRGADDFSYTATSDRGTSVPAAITLFMHQPPVT